jgi:hypothetical protein
LHCPMRRFALPLFLPCLDEAWRKHEDIAM